MVITLTGAVATKQRVEADDREIFGFGTSKACDWSNTNYDGTPNRFSMCAVDVHLGKTTNVKYSEYSQDPNKRWQAPSCDCSAFVGRMLRLSGYDGVQTNEECRNNSSGRCTYWTGEMSAQYDYERKIEPASPTLGVRSSLVEHSNPNIVPVRDLALRGAAPNNNDAKNLFPGDVIVYIDPKTGKPNSCGSHTGIVGWKSEDQDTYETSFNKITGKYPLINCTCGGSNYSYKDLAYHGGIWGVYRVIENAVRYHPNINWPSGAGINVDYISRPNLRAIYAALESGYSINLLSQSSDGSEVTLATLEDDPSAYNKIRDLQNFFYVFRDKLNVQTLRGPGTNNIRDGEGYGSSDSAAYNDVITLKAIED